jgi:hypothetical protein
VSQFFGWDFGINQSSIKILMAKHGLISARMNLQKDGALQTNAVRHADASSNICFTNQVYASHIVFLKYVQEEVLEGINKVTFDIHFF